jgi:enoyl-CoA hydratase/carnithine racemase
LHRAEWAGHHLRQFEDTDAVQGARFRYHCASPHADLKVGATYGRETLIVDAETIFTTDGAIAFFTLNRPSAGNAMTWAMYDALVDACERVNADRAVRVLVIRANGGVFCTGTDIAQFSRFTSGDDGLEYEHRLEAALRSLEAVAVPTIAQVEGIAAGAGLAIALACDLRVCSSAARFGVPIARTLGNALSIDNCARLIYHFGPNLTHDLLFTGRLCGAHEAGIATRIVDPAEVPHAVDELTATIAKNAPLTLRAFKAALAHVSGRQNPEGVRALIAGCYASDDFRNAVAAFLDKKPIAFKGQ